MLVFWSAMGTFDNNGNRVGGLFGIRAAGRPRLGQPVHRPGRRPVRHRDDLRRRVVLRRAGPRARATTASCSRTAAVVRPAGARRRCRPSSGRRQGGLRRDRPRRARLAGRRRRRSPAQPFGAQRDTALDRRASSPGSSCSCRLPDAVGPGRVPDAALAPAPRSARRARSAQRMTLRSRARSLRRGRCPLPAVTRRRSCRPIRAPVLAGPLDPALLEPARRPGVRIGAGCGCAASSDAPGSRSPSIAVAEAVLWTVARFVPARGRAGRSAAAIPVVVALALLVAAVRARPSLGETALAVDAEGGLGDRVSSRARAGRRLPGVGHARRRTTSTSTPPARAVDDAAETDRFVRRQRRDALHALRTAPGLFKPRFSRKPARGRARRRACCSSRSSSSRTRRTPSSPSSATSARPPTARPTGSTTWPTTSRARAATPRTRGRSWPRSCGSSPGSCASDPASSPPTCASSARSRATSGRGSIRRPSSAHRR